MDCPQQISNNLVSMNNENCAFCSKKASYRCSCCVVTPYCSMECQNQHWIQHHKKDCPNMGMLSKPFTFWKQKISPKMKTYFEIMIQYLQDIEDNYAVAWVIETRHLPFYYKISPKAASAYLFPIVDEVKKEMLVVNFNDEMFQRARVCQVYPETDRAIIRFLDTGLSKIVPLSALLQPTPEMERTLALAFRIMFYSDDTASLENGKKIWIQTLGTKTPSGCYNAVQMPDFFGFPFETSKEKTKIEILQIFDEKQAALCRAISDEQIILANCIDDIETFTNSPGEGTFVLAMHAKKWHRGRLIGWSDEASIPHLVYLFDLGKMCFSKTLKKLPTIFHDTKMRAFVIIFDKSTQIDLTALLKVENLSIFFNTETIQAFAIDNKNTPSLNCQLFDGENLLGNVQAQNFTGFLESIDLDCWNETVDDGTTIVITSFADEKHIAITPAWTSKYKTLFDAMANQCVTKAGCSIAEIDDISLAYNIEAERFFRAQYVYHNDDNPDDMMEVLDIDTGKFHFVRIFQLRELNRFLRSCPVYLTYVELADVKSIKPICEDSKVLATLKSCIDNATEFIVKYQDGNTKMPTLYYRSDSNRTLNAEIMKLVYTEQGSQAGASVENISKPNENINKEKKFPNKNLLQNAEPFNQRSVSKLCVAKKFSKENLNGIKPLENDSQKTIEWKTMNGSEDKENSLNFNNKNKPNEYLNKKPPAERSEAAVSNCNEIENITEKNLKKEEAPQKRNPFKKFAILLKDLISKNDETDVSVESKPTNNNNYEAIDHGYVAVNKETFDFIDELKDNPIVIEENKENLEAETLDNVQQKNSHTVTSQENKSINGCEDVKDKPSRLRGIRSILQILQISDAKPNVEEKLQSHKISDINKDVNRGGENLSRGSRRFSILSHLNCDEPKGFMCSDLETIGIEEGENVALLILDASTIGASHFLTAADNTDEKGQDKISGIITKVNDCANEILASAEYYMPRPNEVCLALFCEDNLWYRAMRVDEEEHSSFFIMKFIDFGNVATISKTNIRPMQEKFMFPIISNKCRIKGLNDEKIARLAQANIENNVLYCKVKLNKADGDYDVAINDFDIFF